MKFMSHGKDGGPESTVWGLWFVEIKSLFSVALLRFEGNSREAYHSHAFNCLSWVLKGKLVENHLAGDVEEHTPSLLPVVTKRETFHMVHSCGTTYVLTFRGPWSKTWRENIDGEFHTLTHGRKVVA